MSDAKVNNNMEEQKMEAENEDMSIADFVNSDSVKKCNSETDETQINSETDDEIRKCTDMLVRLSKIKAKAVEIYKTNIKDEEENSAEKKQITSIFRRLADLVMLTLYLGGMRTPDAVSQEVTSSITPAVIPMVVNSNKKRVKGSKSNNRRNAENKQIKPKKPTTTPMELIGKRTYIKRSVYNNINWNSYTKATRTLMVELFPRKVLATHSLTGNKSPAFQHRAAKPSLDGRKIIDIIETVCEKCDVKEYLVRQVITIKCADEAKMLRQREKKKANLRKQHDSDVETDLEKKRRNLEKGQASAKTKFFDVLRLAQRKLQFGD